MPIAYKYKAVSTEGDHHFGTITADNETTVEELLREKSLLPISIQPVAVRRTASFFGFLRRRDYDNLIAFTRSLATLHRAGIPLLRSLSIIGTGGRKDLFTKAVDQMRLEVQSGKSLSEAMAEFPEWFPTVYTNSIAAGEESGHLEETLEELAAMLETEAEITRQLKAGIRYPLMVIIAIVVAFMVMMNFVVPRFVSFYAAFDAQLPLPTRIIIATSNVVTTYWPFFVLGLIAIGFAFRYLLGQEAGRLWFDRQMLRLPLLGELIIKGNVARFSLMFRILLSAGLTIVKCIDILTSTVKNTVISQEIAALGESFRRGEEIDPLSSKYRFFPRQALHMLMIGLESGSLEDMLREIGNHYSKQVIHSSRQLTAMLEPLLTVVMGLFVLILALAIFLPMWNLIKVFQG